MRCRWLAGRASRSGPRVSRRNLRRVGRWCAWATAALLLFTVLTGYGISEFRIVSQLTLGILGKAVSHRLHHYTDGPLLAFLCAHVGISVWLRLC